MSIKINFQGPQAFVPADNRVMHPKAAPFGRDQAHLCLSGSPPIVPDLLWCLSLRHTDTFSFLQTPQVTPQHQVLEPQEPHPVSTCACLSISSRWTRWLLRIHCRGVGKVTHGRGSGLTVKRAERPDVIGAVQIYTFTQMSRLSNCFSLLLWSLQMMLNFEWML